MKHTYFTLFFCLLSLLLGSCDKNVDDFYPPYNYNYYIPVGGIKPVHT